MGEKILCPLCQPVGAELQEKKATAKKYFDGGIIVKCVDCGEYRLRSAASFGRVATAELDVSQLEVIRRVISSENKMGMVAKISSKELGGSKDVFF